MHTDVHSLIIAPNHSGNRGERGTAMAVTLGTDGYRYEVGDNWAKLPPGMEFNADVAAVGVDKSDNVYAFNRGKHPMCVFDRDGNFLRSWGEGIFVRPHGVHMAPDDTIWLTDDGDHTVRHCSFDGKGNSRVHKYTLDGKRVTSCGETGTDPGQFNIAHNTCCDPGGWFYVA